MSIRIALLVTCALSIQVIVFFRSVLFVQLCVDCVLNFVLDGLEQGLRTHIHTHGNGLSYEYSMV